MKSQLVTLFGLVFLVGMSLAQDNSTDTAALAPSDDVKPAVSEAQAANQKVDNQDLEKAKADVNDAASSAKDAGSNVADAAKDKASDAADSVKSGADAAADKIKSGADAAKDKIENSASFTSSSLVGSVVLLALARL